MSNDENIRALILKISKENCERSFRIFFDHFYNRLFSLALHFTKNQVTAEEVVSDVFLKIWKQRDTLQDIQNLRAYLFIAIKRQSLNALRKSRVMTLYTDELEHFLIIETHTPENILFRKEMLKTISQTIQTLPEKCKLVYLLVKEERLKYKEVADLLEISEKTVEMHVGNAIKKIRKDLDALDKTPPKLISPLKSTLIIFLSLLFFLK
jgi:RNA polymerase sigma-70 factor (family 1)